MSPESDLALTRAFLREMHRLRITGADILGKIWRSLAGYDEKNIPQYEKQAAPALESLQLATAAVTAGYLSRIAKTKPPSTKGIEVPQDLRHPFIGVWKSLAEGLAYTDAVNVGMDRSSGLAAERISLTQRLTTHRAKEVVGWRRIPRGVTCSWCVHVSTQRYHTAESASFGHSQKGVEHCDCEIVPIVAHADPGQVINEDLLAKWKQAQNAEQPPAYFDVSRTLKPAARPDA